MLDESKEQGYKSVPAYLKHCTNVKHLSAIAEALSEGEGNLFQSNIVIHGPPGAGKSSVKLLVLGRQPLPKHEQNATDVLEQCVRTIQVGRIATTEECFKEADNDEIIGRLATEVDKYQEQKKKLENEQATSVSISTLSTEESVSANVPSSPDDSTPLTTSVFFLSLMLLFQTI